jgi:SAM-dependent methyltransferase
MCLDRGMYLDLGCGPVETEGFLGVDIEPGPAVTYVCDLQKFPWSFDAQIGPPLEDNSVEGAVSNHLVEHLPDLVGFMRELWRVMKDGARVEISHPYQFNVRAWQDPTHVRCINEVSWFYFDKEWRKGTINTWGGYGDTDFTLVELDAIPTPEYQELADKDPEAFEQAAKSFINVIADLRVVLECRK